MALRWATSALLAVTSFSSITSAATSPKNVFVTDSTSNKTGTITPTWQLGQTVSISWTASYDTVNLGFMLASDERQFIWFYNGNDSSTKWVVDVNETSWAADNVVYYMMIGDANNPDNGFYSKPVYIVAPGSSPTSLSTSVTSVPTSMASVTIVKTAVVTQSQGAPTATSSASAAAATNTQAALLHTATDPDKLSTGTIAGIAIGAIAGAAALAAAIFFLMRNRRLKRDLANSQANTRASYLPYDQLPPNAAGAGAGPFSPDPSKAAVFGGAAVAAGYYGEKGLSAQSRLSELPVARADSHRISELPAGPIHFSEPTHYDPVEIGGTELTRPMDENTPDDARPLMGDHSRDITD